MNTAISNNNSSSRTIGGKTLANTTIGRQAKKNGPKLKLGFRMADTVILLSHRRAIA